MRKTFCDKCGAELEEMKDIRLDWNSGVLQEKMGFIPRRSMYQLCGKCAAEVDKFINTKGEKA